MKLLSKTYTSNRLVILVLSLVIVILYSQVTHFEFVNFDDTYFLTKNTHIEKGLTWQGVSWAFSKHFLMGTDKADLWSPITFISHMLDFEVYGDYAGGHHITNVFLHILFCILLYYLFLRFGIPRLATIILVFFFAIHPVNVESVAWVIERKGLLSSIFALVTILAYLRYLNTQKRRDFLLCAIAYLLGLMSKVTIAPLPFALILLEYWPLQKFTLNRPITATKHLKSKAILLLIAILFCLQTIFYMRNVHNVRSLSEITLSARFENCLVSYASYIVNAAFPYHLTAFYPHPGNHIAYYHVILSIIALLAITLLAIWTIKTEKSIIVGWLWYLGFLFPLSGLVQVGSQAMADRYIYLPFVGLLIMIYGVWNYIRQKMTPHAKYLKKIGAVIIPVYLAYLLLTAYNQIGTWKDSKSLFGYALRVTKNNWLAHNNLGVALLFEDNVKEAREHFNEELRINPTSTLAMFNLGVADYKEHDFPRALIRFNKLADNKSPFPMARFYIGNIYLENGDIEKALTEYENVVRNNPNCAEAYYNIGFICFERGDLNNALKFYSRALEINPDADTLYNVGLIFLRSGNPDRALECFKSALEIEPSHALAKKAFSAIPNGLQPATRKSVH